MTNNDYRWLELPITSSYLRFAIEQFNLRAK